MPERARLVGLGLLAAAGGSSLVHRAVLAGAAGGPALLAEGALALVSFLLASTGVLLLIHGRALFAPVDKTRPPVPGRSRPPAALRHATRRAAVASVLNSHAHLHDGHRQLYRHSQRVTGNASDEHPAT